MERLALKQTASAGAARTSVAMSLPQQAMSQVRCSSPMKAARSYALGLQVGMDVIAIVSVIFEPPFPWVLRQHGHTCLSSTRLALVSGHEYKNLMLGLPLS
jgi:hypothetical protein